MTAKPADDEVSPGQRALWTFLLITLVAPFLAAVVIFLGSVIAGAIGRGPASLLALDRAGQLAWAGEKAVGAYVWSAIPAGIGGAIVAGLVFVRGSTHWLAGATVGALTATMLSVSAGGMIAQHIAPIAFIAAFIGAVMCAGLKAGGIIK